MSARSQLITKLYIRTHTSLIFLGTIFSGLIANHLLYKSNIQSMTARYPFAVAISVLAFIVLIKVWIQLVVKNLSAEERMELNKHQGLKSTNSTENTKVPHRWWTELVSIPDLSDADAIGALIIIIAVLFFVVSGIIIIIEAPVIVVELLLQIMLSSVLVKANRKMDDPDWLGSVFKASLKPATVMILLAWLVGFVASRMAPGCTKLSEVLSHYL